MGASGTVPGGKAGSPALANVGVEVRLSEARGWGYPMGVKSPQPNWHCQSLIRAPSGLRVPAWLA